MRIKTWMLAALAAGLAAGPALARDAYDAAMFVRHGATAAALFQDRDQCRREALNLGSSASAYSDPEYGALSAMGSALDEDALHDGGLTKRMQHAVFGDCMKRRGWTPAELSAEDSKAVLKASARRPEALDAWLKAHEPAESAAPAAPAAQTVKTSAPAAPSAAAPAPAGSAATALKAN